MLLLHLEEAAADPSDDPDPELSDMHIESLEGVPDILTNDDLLDLGTRLEPDDLSDGATATKLKRQMLQMQMERFAAMTIDQRLSYDFLDGVLDCSVRSLVCHSRGDDIQDAENYFRCIMVSWLSATEAEVLRMTTSSADATDKELWIRMLSVASTSQTMRHWKEFARMALRYVCAAASEAAVERLISRQRHVQGQVMTNVSQEGITARLVMYGDRPIGTVMRE